METFLKYYYSKYNGRKLNFLLDYSKVEIFFNINNTKYELHLSTYQMAILFLYNNKNKWTAADICRELSISLKQLNSHISAIINSQILITDKVNPNNIDDNTEIKLNLNYNNKKTRIKLINSIMIEDSKPKDMNMIKNEIVEDRKMVLQAAAVRIMKSRKSIEHNQLVEGKFILKICH